MRDIAAEETDALLAKLEKRIATEYKGAYDAAEEKWQKYLASFEKQDKIEAQRLADGEITKQQYQAWRTRQIANGKQYEEMRNVIAQDLHKTNLKAAKLANNSMADVYALNANYGTYLVEHSGKIDTGFALYNHDSAEALLKEDWKISPETGRNSFLPKPSKKKQKELAGLKSTNPDVLWNSNIMQSAMFQGILTGEPLTDLAKRLASVAVMDKNQAIRNARTLTTNVQNKGRMDAFDRAAEKGVNLVDEWVAILDGATRHSHRHMHGERRPHDSKEPFSNGCRWPGDPQAEAAEVYNCRCRLVSWVKGFEGETVKYNETMGNMSFEEWQNAKAPKQKQSSIDKIINTFKPAETIEDAEEYAKNFVQTEYQSKYSGNISFKGMSIDNANKMNKVLEDVYNNYDVPKLNNLLPMNFRETKWKTAVEDGIAAAYQWMNGGTMYMNQKIFASEKSTSGLIQKANGLLETVLNGIDNLLSVGNIKEKQKIYLEALKKSGVQVFAQKAGLDFTEATFVHEAGHMLDDKLFRKILKNEMFDASASMAKYARGISGYAATSVNEYIAESFTAYWYGYTDIVDPKLSAIFRNAKSAATKVVANDEKTDIISSVKAFAKGSKDFTTVLLPKQEYAHVMSEISTHLTDKQKDEPVFSKAIGNYIYTVENNGFGDYRVIDKKEIKSDIFD